MSEDHRTSTLRRVVLLASHIWLGVGLLLLISLYLSIVSVHTRWARQQLGTTEMGLYSHPILLAMSAAALANLVLASVVRIRLRPANAGALCSHLGILVLAAGCAWYVKAKVTGAAVTVWTPTGWTAVRNFYVNDSYSVYLSADGGVVETPLAVDLAKLDEVQTMDVPLAGAPDGVDIRVTEFRPYASVSEPVWKNDAPSPAPGVSLRVVDRGRPSNLTLVLARPGREHFRHDDWLLYYHPDPPAEALETLKKLAAEHEGSPEPLTPVVIRGRGSSLRCEVLGPEGPIWSGPLSVDEPTMVPLALRTLGLRVIETFTHAMGHCEVRPLSGPPMTRKRSFPAVKVEISAEQVNKTVYVPHDAYGLNLDPVVVDVGDGRTIRLRCSQHRLPLPEAVRTVSARFLTHPGTEIPEDYQSDLELESDGRTRRAMLGLNEPVMTGHYQITQHTWLPSERQDEPAHILMGVNNRPGLEIIWFGCILICAGFPYAFYVKPLLRRRRRAGQ